MNIKAILCLGLGLLAVAPGDLQAMLLHRKRPIRDAALVLTAVGGAVLGGFFLAGYIKARRHPVTSSCKVYWSQARQEYSVVVEVPGKWAVVGDAHREILTLPLSFFAQNDLTRLSLQALHGLWLPALNVDAVLLETRLADPELPGWLGLPLGQRMQYMQQRIGNAHAVRIGAAH